MTSLNQLIRRADGLIIKYLNGLPLEDKVRQEKRIHFLKGLEDEVGLCKEGGTWGKGAQQFLWRIYDVREHINPKKVGQYIVEKPKEWGHYIGLLTGMFEFQPVFILNYGIHNLVSQELKFLMRYAPEFYEYVAKSIPP